MKRVWTLLKEHWYIPLTIAVAILGMVGGVLFQRRFNNPLDTVKDELKAIDSVAETAKLVQKQGVEAASRQLEKTHADTIFDADDRAIAKVKRLRRNPSALSKHLVRTGERLRRERERRARSG